MKLVHTVLNFQCICKYMLTLRGSHLPEVPQRQLPVVVVSAGMLPKVTCCSTWKKENISTRLICRYLEEHIFLKAISKDDSRKFRLNMLLWTHLEHISMLVSSSYIINAQVQLSLNQSKFHQPPRCYKFRSIYYVYVEKHFSKNQC